MDATQPTAVETYDAETLRDKLLEEFTDAEIVDRLRPDAVMTMDAHGPCAHLRPGKWIVRHWGTGRNLVDASIEPID